MNANRYRLVRNRETGLLVPVAEHCSGRRKGASAGLSRAALALTLAMFGHSGHAGNTLPAGTLPSFNKVISGAVTTAISGSQLTVNQSSQKAITHWNNFNIAHGSGVTFDSSYSGLAQHLARIGAAGDPRSIIEGSLKTNGNLQLTLVNPNGFLFTSTARVDVSSLIASALDINDADFLTSLFASAKNNTSSTWDGGSAFGIMDNPDARVDVEKGAVLSTRTATGGRIVLIAPAGVENAGTIETPDGQTILAAGTKAYFVPSGDVRMRGWLVQVDNGSTASNLGDITAERGNITLLGKTVQQNGNLTATTSVGANGSIWLVAGDNHVVTAGSAGHPESAVPTVTGPITLGAGSKTQVLADEDDKLGIDANTTFNKSEIRIMGGSIDSYGTVAAKGGKVSLVALSDLSKYYDQDTYLFDYAPVGNAAQLQNLTRNPANYINLHDGSVIDVSGYNVSDYYDLAAKQRLPLTVAHNMIEAELRPQLADSPLQRYSFLRGAKVKVDGRRGTPLANMDADIAAIKRGVKEKLAAGGKVKMVAQGDTIVAPAATINVSGGAVSYAAGLMNITKLIGADGQVYDISAASRDRIYTGFADSFTTSNAKYGTSASKTYTAPAKPEPGYVDGRDAGSIVIQSHGIALAGKLQGNTSASREQLDPAKTPLAGELQLLDFDVQPLAGDQSHDVQIKSGTAPAPQLAVDGSLKTDQATVLSTDMLAQGGFGRIDVTRAGKIDLAAGENLVLTPGGSLALTGNTVNVAGKIAVPAGKVTLKTQGFGGGLAGDLVVAGSAEVSVAGRWVNELPRQSGANTATRHIDGGSIELDAGGRLLVGDIVNGQPDQAVFDVSGGAYVAPSGKVISGKGGNLSASSAQQLRWQGEVRAKTMGKGIMGKGGSFAFTAPNVVIRNAELSANEYALSETLIVPGSIFNLGFTQYNITAAFGNFTVQDGTQLEVAAPYSDLLPAYTLKNTGSDTATFTKTGSDPLLRQPASVAFVQRTAGTNYDGLLSVGKGAGVKVDQLASITLTGDNIHVDGTLMAPAGNIKLELHRPTLSYGDIPPSQSIWLGSHAALLANGAVRTIPTDDGSLQGNVYGGGSVLLDAYPGWLIAEKKSDNEPYSSIEVAGAQAQFDVQTDAGLQRKTLGSDGGRVGIIAGRGFILDGEIKAGKGYDGSRNGALSVFGEQIEIAAGHDDTRLVKRDLKFGDALDSLLVGYLDKGMVDAAGMDSLTAQAGTIAFNSAFPKEAPLTLPRNLVLDAPVFDMQGNEVMLNSGYLKLGNSDSGTPAASASTSGGSLTASADWIDLFGKFTLNGASQTAFNSNSDIRFIGSQNSGGNLTGSLDTQGDLAFKATQLYAATLHQFTVHSDGGSINIESNGNTPGAVLSAGSQLTFNASEISQGGVVKAPLGVINLDAGSTGTVTLKAGSLTSVSAEGQTIPLGNVDNGTEWNYRVPPLSSPVQSQPVAKAVNLNGKEVVQSAGAQVDISGGGDLYAYEFIAGQGGSKDVLLPENSQGAFAVIPGQTSGYAPYDMLYEQNQTPSQIAGRGAAPGPVTPGQKIYLSGGNGLAAGYYTVLPARYALLKGAYLVTPQSGSADMRTLDNTALPSGASLLAGYKTEAATGQRDARWAGYVVESADQLRNRAEYTDYYANAFYTAKAARNNTQAPYLPADAGRVSVLADTSIVLDGIIKAAHASGTRGGELDLAATRLAVVANGAAAPNGFVTLESGKLNDLGMESIFIGGTRTPVTNDKGITTTILNVKATDVEVESGADLSASELMLAAQGTLTLKAGSKLAGTGSASGAAQSYVIGDADTGVSGDGALVRVASIAQSSLTRDYTSRSTGDLVIESGAQVVADKSLTLDATRSSTVDPGSINLAQGGALALGASRISLGDDTSGVTEGMVVNAGQLAGAREVSLTSYSTLDLYGAANLGSAALDKLNIRAAGIAGYGAGNTASLQAKNVRLDNPGSTGFVAATGQTAGDGSLTVEADNILLADGTFKVRGYRAVNLQAAQDVKVQGDASSFDVARDDSGAPAALNIIASRITAARGADYAINASGKLSTALPSVIAANQAAADLGAKLALTAQSIDHGGKLELPSGIVELHATGSAPTDNVTVTGSILAGGVAKQFDTETAYSPGGQVSLTSDHGNVALGTDAAIDVSATGAEAGRFDVSASQGSFTNAGSLKGSADAGQRQGLFNADVAALPDFGGVNQALNAGGFTESRNLRIRTGDVTIAGADTVKAHNFTLAVDSGKLDVAGSIDASGSQGGAIQMYSRDDLTVQSGAMLSAAATGSGQSGGRIELGSTGGTLALKSGATLDLSGPAGGGKVLLRAARTADNRDVKIAPIAADTIKNAVEIVAEAVKVYDKVGSTAITELGTGTSSGARLGLDSIAADNDAFMLNAATVKTRLGESANTGFHLRSGVEVRTVGDLTVTDDLSLHTWRHDPTTGSPIADAVALASGKNANGDDLESGVLNLRAGENLLFSGSLSDGFNGAENTAALNTGGPAWRYRLVGGADTTAANPMTVKPITPATITGDVTIAEDKLVRTGAADISVAAGRNFNLLGVNELSAALYTAGVAGQPTTPVFTVTSSNMPNPNFPVNGGDISIRAEQDVNGAITYQLFSEWLQRQGMTDANGRLIDVNGMAGGSTLPAAYAPGWWIDFSKFRQGVGALAGGDIDVQAGQDVKNLSAVIPTTARYAGNPGDLVRDLVPLTTGGGNLRVEAGRDVLSGVYLAASGDAMIRAGRDIASGRTVGDTAIYADDGLSGLSAQAIYTLIGVQDGQARLVARRDATLETAVNPTAVPQDSSIVPYEGRTAGLLRTYLYTYKNSDAVKIEALAGDATLNAGAAGDATLSAGKEALVWALAGKNSTDTAEPSDSSHFWMNVISDTQSDNNIDILTTLPPILKTIAFQGNVAVKESASLYPSSAGSLSLLAGDNIALQPGVYLNLSDADPALLPHPGYAPFIADRTGRLTGTRPYSSYADNLNPIAGGRNVAFHALTPVHRGDSDPAHLVALTGDINGNYYLSKPVNVFVGGDVNGGLFNIQHNNLADVSSIIAGGNISYPAESASTSVITMDGPGLLHLQAGNNIELGGSGGVVSRGNQVNTSLPKQGANINLMSGVSGQPDYADFIKQYFNADEQKSIADSIRTLIGQAALNDDQAIDAFANLPQGQQASAPVARQVQERLFLILGQAGYDKTQGKAQPYDKAYAAIASLFPASTLTPGTQEGDINLLYSQVRTLSDGDIYLFAPHGSVNAGQTTATNGDKKPSELGIVTQGVGSIRGLVDGDFQVNTSRVFTLRGTPAGLPALIDAKTFALNDGDIELWSSNGDIDAGRGSKTAVSAPPPLLLTNRTTGETVLVFSSVSGSGIRALLTNNTDTAGVVNLIAPKGTVNAGDAGIGAQNINIAANVVVGAGNIDLGGGFAGGVPTASVGGIAGSVGNVGNSTGDASKTTDTLSQAVANSAAAAQALKDAFKPSFVSVEVVGFGE